MKRKFKKALKEAYHIPEPERRDSFLRDAGLDVPPEKSHKFILFQIQPTIIRSTAAVVTAIAFFGIYTFYQGIPTVPPEMIVDQIQTTTVPPSETQPPAASSDVPKTTQPQAASAQGTTETTPSLPSTDGYTVSTASASYEAFPEGTVETAASGTSSVQETSPAMHTEFNMQPQSTVKSEMPNQPQHTTKTTAKTAKKTTEKTTTRTTAKTKHTTVSTMQTKKTTEAIRTTATAVTTIRTTVPPAPSTTATKEEDLSNRQTTATTRKTEVFPTATTIGTTGPLMTTIATTYIIPDVDHNSVVIPAHQYDITDKIYDNSKGQESPSFDAYTWEEMADDSDVIVSGSIEAIYFTSIDGRPWTQMDIYVINRYKGDRHSDDRFSIYVPGGYMPLAEYISQNNAQASFSDMTQSEISETTLFDSGQNAAMPVQGDCCIFFLSVGSAIVPEGAYQYTYTTDISCFMESAENDTEVSFDPKKIIFSSIGNSSCTFSEYDLKSYLMLY